jgi:soluble lytic murein transglycosylase-like protein
MVISTLFFITSYSCIRTIDKSNQILVTQTTPSFAYPIRLKTQRQTKLQPPLPFDVPLKPFQTLEETEISKQNTNNIKNNDSVFYKALRMNSISFNNIIVNISRRYEVDPDLIRAIIFAESGFNPKAKSKKGAGGLMQLMPSTAKELGVDDIYDPKENIDGGVRYFKSMLDRFDGKVHIALAAYNAGPRHVRKYKGIPPFKATQIYIKKVLNYHKKIKSTKKWAFSKKWTHRTAKLYEATGGVPPWESPM